MNILKLKYYELPFSNIKNTPIMHLYGVVIKYVPLCALLTGIQQRLLDVLNSEWLTGVYSWGAGLSCCCLSGMDTGLTGVFAQGRFPLCSLCWLDDCAKTKGWLPRDINTLWDNSQEWWNTAGMFDNAFIDLTFGDGFIKCCILSSSCELGLVIHSS